jgi:hypothetical protein
MTGGSVAAYVGEPLGTLATWVVRSTMGLNAQCAGYDTTLGTITMLLSTSETGASTALRSLKAGSTTKELPLSPQPPFLGHCLSGPLESGYFLFSGPEVIRIVGDSVERQNYNQMRGGNVALDGWLTGWRDDGAMGVTNWLPPP